jgi:hypothetical protein
MSDTISVTGLVATTPRHITTSEGLAITSFRLASSQRRYDRTQQRWIDADTNWYTVSCFRGLASNAAGSVVKGDRVMVSGRLKIRDWDAGVPLTLGAEVATYVIDGDTRKLNVVTVPGVRSGLTHLADRIPVVFFDPEDTYQDFVLPCFVFVLPRWLQGYSFALRGLGTCVFRLISLLACQCESTLDKQT